MYELRQCHSNMAIINDVLTFARASFKPSSKSCLLKVNALLPGEFYGGKVKFKDKHHKRVGIISG